MADKKNTVSFDEWANGAEVKPAKTGILGRAGDLGLSALKSAIAVPETAVGLANLVSGGKAGKAVESAGIRFKDAKDILDAQKSDAAKDAEWRFQNAEGFTGKLGAAVENPSLIANTLVESAAPMLAGGVVGRGISMAAPRLAGYAGAIGEGAIGAGSAAEQIRQESADGELSGKQAALAGASGLATGLLGYGGSKLAGRLGVGDIDTALAGGARTAGVQAGKEAPGMLKRIGGGALSEGVLEELPQSVSEQMLQNVAIDRDPMQGVDSAAAMGLLSGGLMGGGMGIVSGRAPAAAQPPAQPPVAPSTTPGAPPAATPPAGPTLGESLTSTPMADLMGDGGLTGGANPLQAGLSTLTSNNQMYPGMNTEPTGHTVDPVTGAIIQAEPVGARQMTEPAAQVEAPAPVATPAGRTLGESLTSTPVADMLGSGGMSGPANPLQSVLDTSTPSQRMGFNPAAGGLTAAAAIAVDSGASPVTAGMGLRALSGAAPAAQPVAEQATPQQQAQQPAQQPILNNGKPFTLAEVGKANQSIGGTAVSVPGGWAIQPPQPTQQPAVAPATAMPTAATPAASAQSAILGRNSQPIAEGGQPFATREEAKAEKRMQPLMRVAPAEGGGFILKPASERQLAAVEKAAKRLKYPSTGETGPRSLHGFILQIGGLASGAMPDVGFDLNPRVGNRRLFSPRGKTIEQAAMAAKQEGYIQDEDENTLIETLKRSLNVSPVYTPDGYEAMAEAQMQARYEDFLAAEQDGGAENDWSRLTPEELADTGYNDYDEATQAEIRALVAQAEALGVDAESILEDVAQRTENATQKDYENAAKSAIEAAIRSSEESRSRDLGQASAEAGPATADTQSDPAEVTGPASDVRARNLAELQQKLAGKKKPTPTTPPAQNQQATPAAEQEKPLPPNLSAKLQEAHRALGRDVTRSQVQRMRDSIAREVEIGTTNNGGVIGKLTPKAIATRREQLQKLDADLALFDGQQATPAPEAGPTNQGATNGQGQETLLKAEQPTGAAAMVSGAPVADTSLNRDSSWVIREKATGKVVMETFDRAKVDALNTAKYEAVPIQQHLAEQGAKKPSDTTKPGGFIEKAKKAAGKVDAAPVQPILASPTKADIEAQQARAEQAAKAKAAQDKADAARAAKERERKEVAAASVAAADTFELGQDAMANLTGQQDVFGAIEQESKPTQPKATELTPRQYHEAKLAFIAADTGASMAGARNAALTSVVRNGGNSTAVLTDIAKNSTNPAFKLVAKAILAKGLPFDLRIRTDFTDGKVAHYSTDGHFVEFDPSMPFNLEQVLLHEAVHAVTSKYVASFGDSTPLGKELAALFKLAEQHAKKTGAKFYGLTNADEFLAEVMTNADFAQWLDTVPVPLQKSALSRFVRAVARFFGIQKADGATAQAMDVFERIMLAQSDLQAEASQRLSTSKDAAAVAQAYGVDTEEDGDTVYFGDAEVMLNREDNTYIVTSKNEFSPDHRAAVAWAENNGFASEFAKGTPTKLSPVESMLRDALDATGDMGAAKDMAYEALRRQGVAVKWQEVVDAAKKMGRGTLASNPGADAGRTDTTESPRTPAATIRAAITKAYGNLLDKLEGKGLVTIAQTEREAIEAAAQARADKTGRDAEAIAGRMMSMAGLDVKYSANGNIEGFFDRQTGKSFLVADNLTAASAPGTLMHEVGIHMAADGKLEPLFKRAGSLLKTGTQNEFIQRVKARMARAGETSDEEAAAYIVTEYENDRAKAPITIGKWLADLTAAVRAWLFSKGVILKAEQLTVADIAAVARANARSMARGGPNGGPGGWQAFSRNVGDAAPDEAQRVQAAIEGKSLIDAAMFLTRSSNKANAAIAQKVAEKLKRMEEIGVDLKLHIVHRGDMAPAALANSRGYTESGFDSKGRDVAVWLNGADVAGKVGTEEEVLLHELVHAATTGMVHYGAMNPDTQAGRNMRDLMAVTDAIADHIKQRFADAEAGKVTLTEFELDMREGANNAFRSDDEVLAWALSNAEAQQYLEGIPYKSGSLWSNFVRSVRALLGMSPEMDTALSEVLRVAERLLTDDQAKTGRSAFWHKRGLRMIQQQGRGSIVQTQTRTGLDIRFSRAADMAGNAIDKAKQTADKAMGKDFPRAASMPDLNDDQRSLLGKVGASQSPASDAIKAATDRAGLKIRQGMVDRFAALKELDERALGKDFIGSAITDSAWVLAKMSSAGAGALNAMMKSGRIEMDAQQKVIGLKGAPNGGLTASLQKLGGPAEVERFFAWMAANRSHAIIERNKEAIAKTAEAKRELKNIIEMQAIPGKTAQQVSQLSDARKEWEKIIAKHEPFLDVTERLFTEDEVAAGRTLNAGTTEGGKVRPALYSQVHAEFQQYRDDVLAIAEQAGIINSENRAMWRDEFYVPFYRVMEDDADRGRSGGNGLSRQEAYKKLKGGKQNLNDLMENTLMNFHHLLSASLKNQAAVQAIKNAEHVKIARKLKKVNMGAEADLFMVDGTKTVVSDKKSITFILEKGKKVFYEVDDPLVFESITTLADPGLNNTAVRVMGAFKRLFTNMTTSTPQFIIANTFRDLLQASATSPTSKNIAKNLKEGIQSYRDEKTRAEMLASGGAFSFGHIYGMSADEVKESLQKTVAGAGLISSQSMIPSILRKGWDAWGDITDLSENASRAATYTQNVDELGKLRAAFEARDVMDFSQHGAWPAVRLLVRIVPFLNARLQGLDKLYRSGLKPSILTAMGKGTDTDKQAAARFAMVTGALTLATMALYLVNADDDEYKKLEEWQKDTYWFIRIGENAFFLPKPFEVGALATMAERTLQQAMDDKATGKLFRERMWEMLMQTFAFNPTPQMFQPLIDVYSNKDAFTGRDIESAGMERMSPGLRSRDTTTAPATALSAISRVFGDESSIAVSPVQADHLIKGYLGGVGAMAAGWIDTMYRAATGQSSPDKAWSEYQPIRRFYRDLDVPVANTRYTTLFYDGLKEANRVYADVMELQKLGRPEDAQALATEKRSVLQMRIALNAQQRRLTEINNRMKEVRRSDKDGEWKRRELDLLNTQKALITERLGKRIEDSRVQ